MTGNVNALTFESGGLFDHLAKEVIRQKVWNNGQHGC